MNIQTTIQPYLFFEGKCEEALAFYQQALGAKIEMQMRYKDNPEPPSPECGSIDPEKIMHAQFQVGGTTIMVSDGRCSNQGKFEGFALSLAVATEAEADRYFNALAAGGQVHMPLSRTFFSARFGMVADRFGVSWMVLVHPSGTPPHH